MKFDASVTMSPSKEIEDQKAQQESDLAQMKHHLFSALRILHKQDEGLLDEITSFLHEEV